MRGILASAGGRKEKGLPVEGTACAKAQRPGCDWPLQSLEVSVTGVERTGE